MRRIAAVIATVAVLLAVQAGAQGSIGGSPTVYPLTAVETTTVTIANGDSLSSAAVIPPGFRVAAIIMPAAWTTAAVTFTAATTRTGTYASVGDSDGVEVSIGAPAAAWWYSLSPTKLYGVAHVKIRSGTSATPVAQAGARTITLVMRPY